MTKETKNKEEENKVLTEEKKTTTIDYNKETLSLKEKYHLVTNQFKKISWAHWKDVKKQSLVVTGISVGMIAFFGLIDYAVVLIKDIL